MSNLVRLLVAALLVTAAACADPATAPVASPPSTATAPAAAASSEPPARASQPHTQVLAVADIASCDTEDDEAVAAVVRQHEGLVLIAGDVVYEDGTKQEYADCFDPAWGAMRHRLRPALGNHDFRQRDTDGYFDYFGRGVGRPDEGWYAFDIGDHWRAIVLNSNCARVSCEPDGPQVRWLDEALAEVDERHILAYWHHPRFSTGRHGDDPTVAPFWERLHAAGAAIVLNGHDHIYERHAPQTPQGGPDPAGIRQFTVGTGGFELYEFSTGPADTTEVRNNDTFGVLQLRLDRAGYRWEFLPAVGTFTDRGEHTFDQP